MPPSKRGQKSSRPQEKDKAAGGNSATAAQDNSGSRLRAANSSSRYSAGNNLAMKGVVGSNCGKLELLHSPKNVRPPKKGAYAQKV